MPVGAVSQPTVHKSLEELWYVVGGTGELWSHFGQQECVSELRAGDGLNIPIGAHFQFRNTGADHLNL
jgi:mannose-6-phosphate isomerase-like protein (cupin superfamily)